MNYPEHQILGIALNKNHWVHIEGTDGGFLRDQSVQSVLLFLLLQELRAIREKLNEPEVL